MSLLHKETLSGFVLLILEDEKEEVNKKNEEKMHLREIVDTTATGPRGFPESVLGAGIK